MELFQQLELFIKSRYPLIYFESVDENFAVDQCREAAQRLGFNRYQWSVTQGLKREGVGQAFYKTEDPAMAIKNMMDFLGSAEGVPSLFVLIDFQQYLKDPLVMRQFKDALNRLRNKKDTIVLVSSTYELPQELKMDAAHLLGGYPSEKEIARVIADVIAELKRIDQVYDVVLTDQQQLQVVQTLKGLSLQQIRNIINRCVMQDYKLDFNDIDSIKEYKKKVFDKDQLLEFCSTEKICDVAGFEQLKIWVKERKDVFFTRQESLIPAPKGILLMGIQGCGKSLAVKMIADELGLPLYRLDISSLYSMYIGETEKNLKKVFNVIDQMSPLCLWIDEIEKGFSASQSDADGGVSQRVFGTFLTWMQERKSKCFLAATANNVTKLPPEFMRKGRFDEIFFVDLPDEKIREKLFDIHLSKQGLNSAQFSLSALAKSSQHYSGAEVEQAIIASIYRVQAKSQQLATEHILEQLRVSEPLAVLRKEEILELRNWCQNRARAV